ncbi:PRC-barrel domain-containing protein (plasmid) [Roseivivax marinus]|uniref:PRC-barrel domain-containing protein n=1 Tax=Roseivivax marinus TaxID=1379903 RepID=UPI001F03C255|nr:PRC-barrel domain-containing protein [Roseivivax marinus]UMA66995.1 PRC-barrel domain-containing protein [Roseivivax marinus]
MKPHVAILAIAGTTSLSSPGIAQEVVDAGTIQFNEDQVAELYNGTAWSIESAYGHDVEGGDGDIIGHIEDFVIDTDGRLVAMVAEVGGFWDLGDTHVSIPWEEVDFQVSGPVGVPVTEENVDEYNLFNYAYSQQDEYQPNNDGVSSDIAVGVDDVQLDNRLWRASDLIGTYARVMGGEDTWANFGFVRDILIDNSEINATVVNTTPAHGPTVYAYPYERMQQQGDSAWWVPGDPTYDIPILLSKVANQAEFDPERMNSE